MSDAKGRASGLRRRRDGFERWLEGRAPRETWAQLNLADLELVYLALNGQAEALTEVERRLQRAAAGVRRGDADLTQEVLQRARERLLVGGEKAKLGAYRGQGALMQYLKVVVSSVSVDLSRGRAVKEQGQGDDQLVAMASDEQGADARLINHAHRQNFTHAFKAALTKLSAEERTWLRLRFVEGLPIEAVGAAFGVHRTTAMRRLEKAQQTLLKETRRLLAEQLKLPSRELDSLLRGLKPSLAENLSRLLPGAQQ